ncbi:MAG: ATP-binding cassette domain-containing protein [Bacteroidota bacterium]
MLSIENLTVTYGEQEVLRQLSTRFEYNEIHGIVGMNGAGKTTLFNTLYGFKKAQNGRILLDGAVLDSRQIAFLETRNYFYPYLHGREYLQLLSLGKQDFDINEWNRLFDLPLDTPVDQYSTGMKKKLAFMGMLALDRPIVILDEPFNGVDVESNEKIRQILERIRSPKRIILLSSHIMGSLTGVCDRISYLTKGEMSRTFLQKDFGQLEEMLQELIRQQIEGTLDDLFGKIAV